MNVKRPKVARASPAPTAVKGNIKPSEATPAATERRCRSRNSLYQAILDDILKLARLRYDRVTEDGEVIAGVGDGERDIFLFTAVVAAANIHPGRYLADSRRLAAMLVPGKPEAWVADKLRAIESRISRHMEGQQACRQGRTASPIYSPSIAWFIRQLAITDSEMTHLTKLVSDAIAKRRLRARKPARDWRAERQEQTEELAVIAAELYYRRNMDAPDAARRLKVSERKFWSLLKVALERASAA